jgi:hypothetical protein
VLVSGVPGFSASGWLPVLEVKPGETRRGVRDENGELVWQTGAELGLLDIVFEGFSNSGVEADKLHRVALSGDEKRALIEQARDYEATLTKSGTVRKSTTK